MFRFSAAGAPLLVLCIFCLAPFQASTADAGFYFDASTELIDLPYPGTEFYGEVDLTLLSLNNLRVDVNAYTSPGEYDSLGNYITSPLVAGPNFGIMKFGINSSLVTSEADYDAFMELYDLTMPDNWGCEWGGVAGALGKFEFWYKNTGNSRQDPLVILFTPKDGVVIPTGFEIDSVFDFVEVCPQGTYFSMHVADFSTDPSYWDNGYVDPPSGYFAVSGDTYVVPEPAMLIVLLLAAGLLRMKRR
jgi:hypothetical protein